MTQSELEELILNNYNIDSINKRPATEKELLNCYYLYMDPLYQYARLHKRNFFIYSISNEIRAMLGHLADYRIKGDKDNKRNLDKAYGHFRRANLDAFKILCNQYDAVFSRKLTQEFKYDYRNVAKDYLKQFGEMYFRAKNLYEKAQQEECVGSDRYAHNIFQIYYDALKEYILLRQFYDTKKTAIRRKRRLAIAKRLFLSGAGVFGIIVAILQIIC